VARSLRNGVAAQGLPVARLKVGQCDTSPWGSQRLSSTSSPTGVLRPGYAQLPGIGWECSGGGGTACGEAGGAAGDPPSPVVASVRGR
jgi:hypothetical protein